MQKTYLCIDLKSFYASVECQERGLDPLNTNLVVADSSRTEKTICLAVSPSLKQYGIKGRARLFEVVQKVREVNLERKKKNSFGRFRGKSYLNNELREDLSLELDYIVAPPQMKKYIKYSTEIYNVYLKFVSSDDIYVYSIDEVFCDITSYLKHYQNDPKLMASRMIQEVCRKTGITATAGIGSNLYLAKVAMDIVAKHVDANQDGVRIGVLDEISYRKQLWSHRPITDFWRVGKGYQKKLENNHLYTMGDIARCSLTNEEKLYKLFGVNAEFLIDHAWGYEPCTLKDIKSYKPENNSISAGQVLHCAYDFSKARLIVLEMLESVSLTLVSKKLLTDQITLTIGYDIDNLNISSIRDSYKGEITTDFYGRSIPKHTHGTVSFSYPTSSTKLLMEKGISFYDKMVQKNLLIRRINISANRLVSEEKVKDKPRYEQISLFSAIEEEPKDIRKEEEKEKNVQKVLLEIKNKYGKNAILKGMDLEEGATAIDRNNQVGGHRG